MIIHDLGFAASGLSSARLQKNPLAGSQTYIVLYFVAHCVYYCTVVFRLLHTSYHCWIKFKAASCFSLHPKSLLSIRSSSSVLWTGVCPLWAAGVHLSGSQEWVSMYQQSWPPSYSIWYSEFFFWFNITIHAYCICFCINIFFSNFGQ